jgi:PPP family 3-phenylpropionic acid transporter
LKRGFAVYYLTCFTLFAVITPNLQLLLNELGWDYLQFGTHQGVYQLVGVSGPLLIGVLADRSGRYRSLLFLGYLSLLPLFFLMGLDFSFIFTLILIGLIGISLKSIVPLSDALLSNSLDNPQEDYGKLRVWGSIGFLLCTVVIDYSGILEVNFVRSFNLLILVTTLLTMGTLFLLPARGGRKQEDVKVSKGPPIPRIFWLLMALLFVAWFAQSAYFSFFSIFLRERTSITRINLQWGLGALFEIPLIFLSGPLIRRRGLKPLLIFTFVMVALRLFLYSLVKDSLILTMSQVLHSVTFGLLHSISIAVINRFVSRDKLAQAMTLYSAVIRGGSAFLGSTLGGLISKHWGLESLFLVYSLFPLPLIVILFFIPREKLEWNVRSENHEKNLSNINDSDSPGTMGTGAPPKS